MKVAIVKYNAGNIRSVDCALRRLGVEAMITADEAMLRSADKVIFPGVGEAATTMDFCILRVWILLLKVWRNLCWAFA